MKLETEIWKLEIRNGNWNWNGHGMLWMYGGRLLWPKSALPSSIWQLQSSNLQLDLLETRAPKKAGIYGLEGIPTSSIYTALLSVYVSVYEEV